MAVSGLGEVRQKVLSDQLAVISEKTGCIILCLKVLCLMS
jgi:hypothetical protein